MTGKPHQTALSSVPVSATRRCALTEHGSAATGASTARPGSRRYAYREIPTMKGCSCSAHGLEEVWAGACLSWP